MNSNRTWIELTQFDNEIELSSNGDLRRKRVFQGDDIPTMHDYKIQVEPTGYRFCRVRFNNKRYVLNIDKLVAEYFIEEHNLL